MVLDGDPEKETSVLSVALTNVLVWLTATVSTRFNVSFIESNGTNVTYTLGGVTYNLDLSHVPGVSSDKTNYLSLARVLQDAKPNTALYIIIAVITLVALVVTAVMVISLNRRKHAYGSYTPVDDFSDFS
eukprot:TRINITY_DN3268_c0_g3_i2.p1 TRINITY_DN3268_c0_g3~~TRINITY_DN3268_c0_g3_i2.p1  ORF type:complete len:130 (+),score=26.81 TRINITY_DN3268_c0_g3_i2:199-588(+)